MSGEPRIHPTAVVDPDARVGAGTRIWHFCHVMEGARIGRDCVLGQNVFVASTAKVGDGCRIQNNVSLYDGVELGRDVFVGPSAVFTNVSRPRAGFPRRDRYERTEVRDGATVGANATVRCGVTVGRGALVAAAALVLRSVPSFTVVGGVPAAVMGRVCLCGEEPAVDLVCGSCGRRYRESGDGLELLGTGSE